MKFHRLLSAADRDFIALLRIYRDAHPASERKSFGALARMIERPEYFFLTALDGETVVGFAIAIVLTDSDAALLEYMAVDTEFRGRGVGAALFHAVAEWPEIADRFLLVEVDSDREGSAERQERARRKAFYRRLGARELEGVRYLMPPVTEAPPPPMEMLVYRREVPGSVEMERVRGWLEDCYAQVYGVAAGDPRIDAMVEGCAECIPLS